MVEKKFFANLENGSKVEEITLKLKQMDAMKEYVK